ncbi:RB1-inducible coiled-coil protein 1 isoform X3 [Macrosteles quadrilineatus]|uniref:RB1-inducible coiled-coil protein 1 isoform X3 n=1 Tax=Macrosteles quadrilineatus TaxID=74068 RepID=UPI0023E33FEC|nr:RB1-inducible coiled-coil protein 1 isoform X3 [Macrosteles quadrilineatus]
MLYMFNVDVGTMMTFDINLGMELVSVLQEHIAKEHKIPVDMQVLLVSGGITLPPNQRVCHFSAGTDTNPIFLYNKQFYHHPSPEAPQELLSFDAGPEHPDMKAEVDTSLVLPDTINTVVVRSHLAQRFCEMARDEMRACERLVHEQHLMHQGYAAVIANMDDTIPTVKANMDNFVSYFQEFLESKQHYYQLSETVGEVAQTLATIPLMPSLVDLAVQDPLANVSSCQELSQRKNNVSLLDWLHLRNSNDSFHKLSQMCSKGIQQHNEDIVSSLQALLSHAVTQSQDENMRNIGGLSERFSGLERLLREIRSCVQEQGDLAQALQQNSTRASNLGDASILPDLCASHRRQLLVMQTNHRKIRDIRRRIVAAKTELIQNIYMRMKWVNGVETEIAHVFERTQMYMNSLKVLKEQLTILQQTHNIPHLYLTAVAEVVRRRTFSHAFLMWANDLACQLCAVHSEEVARRQNFQSQFDGHMLNTLFPGLEDSPPPFATQAPESFDTKLPKITIEDLELLKEKVADYALTVSMPDLNAITQFFASRSITNPMKPKEVERLVEEVTAMEQPSDSQAGAGYLASVLPITDRGFESETDTEEFEKVGQSPTDLAFEKRGENDQEQKAGRLSRAREEMEKSIVNIRHDLSSLKDWLKSEHDHVHSFLQQLTTAYHNDVHSKTQLIYQLRQEVADREAELGEMRAMTEELQKRLTLSLETEARERERREEAEATRERAVKEATEQLAHDHKMEMEAVRSRFRLMATASMERSPSELSLERMDKDSVGEEVMAQVRAELTQEKERAVEEERQRWQSRLDHEMHQLKIRADAEKQIWFNEAMRRVLVEKDRQLENLRVHSIHLETECQNHRDTIHRLTGTTGSLTSEGSLLERVEALEAAKVKLEAELAEARGSSPNTSVTLASSAPTHQDMSTSIAALCDSEAGLRDAATSPDPVRKTQIKDKLTKSTTSLIQQGKVSVGSCNIGETVLVVWDDSYQSYMILQESSTLYFLHPDSLGAMSLMCSLDGSPRRIYSVAEVVEKEYCHARKPVNRYNVAKGTKFYRVKVKPLSVLSHNSQSSSGCSA